MEWIGGLRDRWSDDLLVVALLHQSNNPLLQSFLLHLWIKILPQPDIRLHFNHIADDALAILSNVIFKRQNGRRAGFGQLRLPANLAMPKSRI
jgi:hypothetical protein